MDSAQIVRQAQDMLEQARVRFAEESNKLRTGRAHPSMLDGILVEAYESKMPLNQLATISVPEPTTLQVSPFDVANLAAISAAISADQQLGFNPVDDGRLVRIPIPALTTERRQQIVKTLGEKKEEAFISMRNARHDALKSVKDAGMNQDDAKRAESQIEDAMSKVKADLETLAKQKEEEILKI